MEYHSRQTDSRQSFDEEEGIGLSDFHLEFQRDQPEKETTSNGTTVVKIGGSTLGSNDTTLQDLVALQKQGISPVVVHGGVRTISDWMEKQGVRPRFVNGLRVTDAPSPDIVVAVAAGMGAIE